jgi:hypothetical protein
MPLVRVVRTIWFKSIFLLSHIIIQIPMGMIKIRQSLSADAEQLWDI